MHFFDVRTQRCVEIQNVKYTQCTECVDAIDINTIFNMKH